MRRACCGPSLEERSLLALDLRLRKAGHRSRSPLRVASGESLIMWKGYKRRFVQKTFQAVGLDKKARERETARAARRAPSLPASTARP